jgi:hypothetical protein
MSLFHFRAKPSNVKEGAKLGIVKGPNRENKAKYKNTMFDEHIFRGSTLQGSLPKTLELSKENDIQVANMNSKFHTNMINEKKIASIDLKLENRIKEKLLSKKNGYSSTLKIKRFFLDDTVENQTQDMVPAYENRENMTENGTMTDEYVEHLTDKFPQMDADVQTEPLLSRCVKKEKILHRSHPEKSTQIEKEDYLVSFDEQTISVVRVLMNKILEQSRMEVLEEQEMEMIKFEKRQNQQEKIKIMNSIQRLKTKEDRLETEKAKRELQNQIMKQNSILVHKKLTASAFAKKMFFKLQTESEQEFKNMNNYLQLSETKLWMEILPVYFDKIQDDIEEELEYKAVADKMFVESLGNLFTFASIHVGKRPK